jgi:RNA polymerase sigma-B factor
MGVTQMSTGVLVQPHRSGGPHGGPEDCGCGRAGCHADFAVLAATADPAAYERLRTRIIEAHLNLAYSIAARYRRLAVEFDDLRQVAALALVEAVNRFDPDRGTAFSAFAVPTVAGALKRYFRDEPWVVQPPRRIKELRLRIRAATDPLTQRLRHLPTVNDLAEHLECSPQDIQEAVASDDAMRPLSIDVPVKTADDTDLASTLGDEDGAYDHLEDVLTLRPLLAELSEREQRVLTMRFAGNLTQAQIAEKIGCSQMQISRILRTTLDWLRQAFQYPRSEGSRRPGPDDNAGVDATPFTTEQTVGAPVRRRPCRPSAKRASRRRHRVRPATTLRAGPDRHVVRARSPTGHRRIVRMGHRRPPIGEPS